MADINIGKAPKNYAILPFYGMGAISFAAFSVLLLISHNDFTGHYFHPHILALVHIMALGWGTMVIWGASYQMLPVICEHDLWEPRLALGSFFLLTAGMIMLVTSFWDFNVGISTVTGGSLVVAGAILYFINVVFTAGTCRRYNISKLFIISSSVWLMFTTTVGLLLAINLWHPYINASHLDYLKLHAHAGLAGWFLQLVIGVSAKLIPMFLLGKSKKEKYLKYAFVFINASLVLFLADGFFCGLTSRILLYAAMVFAGLVCHVIFLVDAFKNRVPRPIDFQLRHSFVSFILLVISFFVIPCLIFFNNHAFAMLYGCLLFMGWITSIIMGMTFKTLPFIVWNDQYKNITGKQKVPLPKDLYNETLVKYQFYIFLSALTMFAVSLLVQSHIFTLVAACLWLVLSCIYVYNVFSVLLHKAKIF